MAASVRIGFNSFGWRRQGGASSQSVWLDFGASSFHCFIHVILKPLELVAEHTSQLRCLLVISARISPGVSRSEQFSRHAMAFGRHLQTEDGISVVCNVVELPVQGGMQ